ncbi:type I secretion system permease/ATPase [Alsobacter sp. R-9]
MIHKTAAPALAVVFVLSFFINLSVLVSPLYMQNIFDRVLQTHHGETLVWLTVVVMAILLVIGVLEALRGLVLARIGRWWDETLREDVLSAAVESTRRTGIPTTGVVQDLATVRNFAGSSAALPFFDAPWMPLFLGVIALIHPLLGLIALLAALTLVGLAFVMDRGSRALQATAADEGQRSTAFAASMIRHGDTVFGMGMLWNLLDRYKALQQPVVQATQRAADYAAGITGLTKFVRLGIQIFLLGVGAWLAINNQVTSGGMIAASIILGRALAPAEQALGAWRNFSQARAAHRRLVLLLEAVPPPAETMKLPAPQGDLEVENVIFVLPGQERPVLRQVSFKVPAGQTLALIGPSASGKSTLCRLLVGSWLPSQGQVRLDGAAVSSINRAQAARYVGYMAQSVELFAGTVKDNIARFNEARDEDVVAAARLAGCHDMILRLPKGYETEIGEGGSYLSGGQRQRIGLARAVFGDPRLVVLDEPNSNLDSDGEQALLRTLEALRQRGVTVVIVSHRAAALKAADYIGVFREGALERFGEREAITRELRGATGPRQPQAERPAALRPGPASNDTAPPAATAEALS